VEVTAKVDPAIARLELVQRCHLDRGMADDVKQRLVAPDVAFERGDVEIADQDRRASAGFRPARHPLDEVELLAELVILASIGNIAAGGDIDIFEPDPAFEADADVPRLAIGLPVVSFLLPQWQLAEDRDAVVHALAAQDQMRISEAAEDRVGKVAVDDLGFLQAQDIRLLFDQEALDDVEPRSHRIDVPGSNLQIWHGGACSERRVASRQSGAFDADVQ
jgi:hypothetical protein